MCIRDRFRYVSYIWLPNCTISPTEKNVVHARQSWNLKGVFLYIYCRKKIPSMHITLICFLRGIIKVTSNIRSIPYRMLKMNKFLGGWYLVFQYPSLSSTGYIFTSKALCTLWEGTLSSVIELFNRNGKLNYCKKVHCIKSEGDQL